MLRSQRTWRTALHAVTMYDLDESASVCECLQTPAQADAVYYVLIRILEEVEG